MSQTKVYVGNLAYGTTEEDLRELCTPFGEIAELKLIIDRETGRSKGFAFITFADASGAEKAITLNGNEFQGRNLRVNMANDDDRGGRRSSGGGNGGGARRGGGGRGDRQSWS